MSEVGRGKEESLPPVNSTWSRLGERERAGRAAEGISSMVQGRAGNTMGCTTPYQFSPFPSQCCKLDPFALGIRSCPWAVDWAPTVLEYFWLVVFYEGFKNRLHRLYIDITKWSRSAVLGCVLVQLFCFSGQNRCHLVSHRVGSLLLLWHDSLFYTLTWFLVFPPVYEEQLINVGFFSFPFHLLYFFDLSKCSSFSLS